MLDQRVKKQCRRKQPNQRSRKPNRPRRDTSKSNTKWNRISRGKELDINFICIRTFNTFYREFCIIFLFYSANNNKLNSWSYSLDKNEAFFRAYVAILIHFLWFKSAFVLEICFYVQKYVRWVNERCIFELKFPSFRFHRKSTRLEILKTIIRFKR